MSQARPRRKFNCLSHLTLAFTQDHVDPDGEIKTPSPEPLTKQIHKGSSKSSLALWLLMN
jgi:hypothetical protein